MILGTYPLIAWGSAGDMSASPYAGSNCTITGGQSDPFGGTSASLLTDAEVTLESYARMSFVPASALAFGTFVLKAGTATSTTIRLWDVTGSANRASATITWSGVTVTASVGSVYGPVSLGNSWYAFLLVGTGVVAGNTMYKLINPQSGAYAGTGTCYWYDRNLVLLDNPSQYRRFARPRGGYETAVTTAGVRDSWSYGDEWVRTARQSWVPATARSTPVVVSGFEGANEATGVNCGVEAMLRAGWDMQSMTWVPDRSACSVNQSVYLTAPGQDWQPQTEGNGDTAFDMELVSASAPGAVA